VGASQRKQAAAFEKAQSKDRSAVHSASQKRASAQEKVINPQGGASPDAPERR
jgi:hypothetical protein